MDRVINTIMNISNNKPIETGAIYNAMSQISGIKLIWQDKIDGLKGNTGGYLVDLTNYNYNVPILYGLQNNKPRDLTSIQFQKLTAEEKAKTIEQVTKEHRSITALKDLSAKLAHRIGGKVEFVNRSDVDWKGYRKGMTFVLNEAYMTNDTPFHEFSHIFIEAIKQNKPELYNNLIKELETSETGRKVFEQVKRDYNRKKPLREKPNMALSPASRNNRKLNTVNIREKRETT